ncbi:MAG: S41 family peptidase [Pseudomonadota bacterium]
MNKSLIILVATATFLVGCGGGSGDGFAGPQTGTSECSNDGQKSFVLEAMRDIYFWNDLLPTNVDLNQFASPEELLVSLTSVQPLDRFSFIGSAAADAAFFNEGETVAFGFSTTFLSADDVRFVRVFAGSPADNAGIERGQRLLAVDGRTIAEIEAAEGLGEAFGPSETGVQRTLRIQLPDNSEFDAVLTKAVFTIDPVPQVRTYTINGTTFGYIELSTFISTAQAPLEAALSDFNQAGINDLILDLRYNGGGLVSIANLLGDLLGGRVAQGRVFSETLFNDGNIDENVTEFFDLLNQSMNLSRLVVITTGGTASASELVINSMEPEVQVQLVGSDTFGKPVGQVGIVFCEKILRPTAFETVNNLGEGRYFDGLPVDCPAADDVFSEVGSQQDPSTAAALALLSTGACPPAPAQAKAVQEIAPFTPPRARTTAQAEAYIY